MSAIPNLRHLIAFGAAVRRGSVRAAADEVHLSQPAISQAVADLERVFGMTLLTRGPRGVQPTPAGECCAARFERAVAQLQAGLAGAGASLPDPVQALLAITAGQLSALRDVIDAGGFGAAARAQQAARTTFYRSVRGLEQRLGTCLFEPTSHGTRPTRIAEQLARGVRLASAELYQCRAELADLRGHDSGQTIIGAMPLARRAVLPPATMRFAAIRPGHHVGILEGPYDTLVRALLDAKADLLVGALRPTTDERLVQERLFEDSLVILARKAHPLARARRALDARQLAAYPWIAPLPGTPLREQFERLFLNDGCLPPTAMIECNAADAACAMLACSDHLALLSRRQVDPEIRARQLVALPHPAGRVTRTIGLTTRRDWRPTGAQRELIALLREEGGRAEVAPPRGHRRARAG